MQTSEFCKEILEQVEQRIKDRENRLEQLINTIKEERLDQLEARITQTEAFMNSLKSLENHFKIQHELLKELIEKVNESTISHTPEQVPDQEQVSDQEQVPDYVKQLNDRLDTLEKTIQVLDVSMTKIIDKSLPLKYDDNNQVIEPKYAPPLKY